ncbi:MAG: hypothetical protein JWM87_238 [Candidatus Eremiobacteraeota bacterium]|nr:hypothetical protein [Candidatus Eremiobacteraeota bacterium]
MKADVSRSTFDPRKHYAGVIMQQGRVQLDADWNEQQAIVRRRLRVQAQDLIGEAGAPLHAAGFGIALHEDSTRLTISGGRYYVDGLLCENERAVCWDEQPYLDVTAEPEHGGVIAHLYYLDAWERHVSALEDPNLREVALGGPDTTTRIQNVWQVRRMPITKRSFVEDAGELRRREHELYERLGELEETSGDRRALEAILTDVREIVEIVATSGHRRPTRLQEQLERRIDELVEELQEIKEAPPDLSGLEHLVHELIETARPSEAQAEHLRRKMRSLDRTVDEHVGRHAVVRALRKLVAEAAQLTLHEFDSHAGHVRAMVEVLEHAPEFRRRAFDLLEMLLDYERELDELPVDLSRDEEIQEFESLRRRRPGALAARTYSGEAGYSGLDNLLYRVEIHDPSASGKPTFKWSNANASVAALVLEVQDADLLVEPPAGDGMALFPLQAFVEISDVRAELAGMAGEIAKILDSDADLGRLSLDEPVKAHPVDERIVIVRRWNDTDGHALREIEEGTWYELEHGIEVSFSRGSYATGDYWLIPARTATQSVEWPRDGEGLPEHREPAGIRHRYAPLAIVTSSPRGLEIRDKRRFFAPLTRGAPHDHGHGDGDGDRDRDRDRDEAGERETRRHALHVTNINWDNDDELALDLENEGLRVELDRAPDPQSIQPQAVVVTVEPYGDRPDNASHTPVVLNGDLMLDDRSIVWRATRDVNARIIELRNTWRVHNVLLHVLVKGHAVWADDGGTLIYLAGRAYHVPAQKQRGGLRVKLQLPSRGDESGSDFEGWGIL